MTFLETLSCISSNFGASINTKDDDALSGSRDDLNMLDGQNSIRLQHHIRSEKKGDRRATGSAIVEAILEIATALRTRANAGGDQLVFFQCFAPIPEF